MCDTRENLRDSARAVTVGLQQAGYTAYWAGGCVRDRLLGVEPKDYDVATDARPDDVIRLFPGASLVGKSFGVVIIPFQGFAFEVATFRKDFNYIDGRHPERVEFVTAREDAARRDFTINAMFYDPIADVLHDYVGGQRDLRLKLIRCVGVAEERFREDHLRMLRAVRFAARLEFSIEPSTADAIRRHAASIRRISPERVGDELTRMLMEAKYPGNAILLLEELGLLELILPEVAALRHQEQPPQFHPEGDVLTHTVLMLNDLKWRSPELLYAVLLHDLGKPPTARHDGERWRFNCHAEKGAEMARVIMRRLRLPNVLIESVAHCVKNHMRFMDVQKMRRATLRRMLGHPLFDTELELHRVDCSSSHGKLDNYDFVVKTREKFANEPVLPEKWIDGRDIMALGVPPGPEIGRWLKIAYDAQLNGEQPDRDALLAWLKDEIERQ